MIIIRAVFSLAVLTLAGVLVVVLSGHLWGRYQEETAALGFGGVSERRKSVLRDPSTPSGRSSRPTQGRRRGMFEKSKLSRYHRLSSEKQRRSRNSAAETMAIYLLAPLLLPLVFAAVLWGLTIERPRLR
jgi:hypothetical protein